MSQCDAPGSAERDPDDGFVERPWRAAAAFVRRSGLPAGDGPCRTAAERVRHSRMTPVPQPSVTLVTEAPTLTGIDPFVPGSMLLTYPRSKTRDANAGSPRSNRVLVLPMVGSGCLVEFPPRREQGLEGTRSLLSSRLQREHEGADPIPARPSTCRWLGHRESSFCCGRLRPITRKRPTVAGGAPLLCFPIPFARDSAMRSRVWISDRRRGHATPLVVAHGARRVWRHPANSIVTMLDRRTLDTNASAKNRPHRQPEVPSIESPGVNARPTGKGPDPLARSRGRRAG
jgi:hypothetical protein